MIIFGIAGLLVSSYAIWEKKERRQDTLFVIGGLSLLVYSWYKRDYVFIILQVVFILSSFAELLKKKK
jgi:lipid-A-disaccharide synthase-like uncharacterized protein